MSPPPSCSVAFKEWSGVCEALAEGRQVVIFRKGGIAEGPGGFAPEHPSFWLYPTHLHQAQQGLRDEGPPPSPPADAGRVDLRALATVDAIHYVESLSSLERLVDEHAWSAETVRSRFSYRRPGLWVLLVRVFVRPIPWSLPISPEQAGCRTWVDLAGPLPTDGMVPALGEADFRRRAGRVRAVLAGEGPGERGA